MNRLLSALILLSLFAACTSSPETPRYPSKIIEIQPDSASRIASEITNFVSVNLAEGIKMDLWASDTLVNDPIAISVSNNGKIYYTQASRQTNSEFDIRAHPSWMTASISFQTIEDRSKFLKSTFSETNEEGERFLKDLNGDSVLDWRDLAVTKEQVWVVSDESGNGVADRAQLYLEDFNEEITDVANGIEEHNGEVFIAVGPEFWRTKDTNGDGIADETTSLARGFAIHIGFSGHGMSGAKIGPDGRIWWGIGDIGMNLIDKDGKHWEYPNQGVIVRSELDGSGFEVYSAGLRNTHEFTFDEYGNLITEDNDGDHSHRGERERLVHLINGSDGGWRTNWQFGKYNDPSNNGYKVWMDEVMHKPRWEGQAEYILPPIQNYVNGPTGFVYNPGTALSEKWKNYFFVSEFRGSPVNSPIHAFKLKPKGASFELDTTLIFAQGILPTGIDFGPDGALYAGDWIDGWDTKKEGRIWKLDVSEGASAIRKSTEELIRADFSGEKEARLGTLLGHVDMRVRQKAQFELAKRGDVGMKQFKLAIEQRENQLARVHGIWGIGQQARLENMDFMEAVLPLLIDPDVEIRTQAVKIVGDVKYTLAAPALLTLLNDPSPRLQMITVEALGRMEYADAVQPILSVIERNNDVDTWIRHAGMIALGRIGNSDAMAALSDHPNRAIRIAAVVALRRMKSPLVAKFLNDSDQGVATDAARAINDDFSIPEALPALANTLNTTKYTHEAYLRRAINANLRVGGGDNENNLIAFISNNGNPATMRAEALEVVRTWENPSVLDRVDGRVRGEMKHDASSMKSEFSTIVDKLLALSQPVEVQIAAIKSAAQYGLSDQVSSIQRLFSKGASENVRLNALKALASLNPNELPSYLEQAFNDAGDGVRTVGMQILAETDVDEAKSVALFAQILKKGTKAEKQVAITSIGSFKGPEAVKALAAVFTQLTTGKLEPALHLDLEEAIENQGDEGLKGNLTAYIDGLGDDALAPFLSTLEGGNYRNGGSIFYEHAAAQCVRCHSIFEMGGNAGPVLAGVGDRLTKKQLLASIIDPSATYALGYEISRLTLSNDEKITGVVIEETENSLSLKMGNDGIRKIMKSEISARTAVPSAMPPMGGILTKREIRDLIEFLSSLKEE